MLRALLSLKNDRQAQTERKTVMERWELAYAICSQGPGSKLLNYECIMNVLTLYLERLTHSLLGPAQKLQCKI